MDDEIEAGLERRRQQLARLLLEAGRDGIEAFSVGGVLVRGQLVLVLIRASDLPFLPGWGDIPGGHVHPNEGLEEALHRETLEETGLRVTWIGDYLGSFDYVNGRGLRVRQFNFMIGTTDAPIRLAPNEHSSYAWCDLRDPAELTRLRVSDEVRAILFAARTSLSRS